MVKKRCYGWKNYNFFPKIWNLGAPLFFSEEHTKSFAADNVRHWFLYYCENAGDVFLFMLTLNCWSYWPCKKCWWYLSVCVSTIPGRGMCSKCDLLTTTSFTWENIFENILIFLCPEKYCCPVRAISSPNHIKLIPRPYQILGRALQNIFSITSNKSSVWSNHLLGR